MTKLSADDKDLDGVASAYLEFAPNDCNAVAVAVDGLKSYITGMNSYFQSDVFAINIPGKDSSVGFMSVYLNGCKVTIEDLFISQEMRKLGVGRAAIEALGGRIHMLLLLNYCLYHLLRSFMQRLDLNLLFLRLMRKCLYGEKIYIDLL